MRVVEAIPEGPGVVSLRITGRRLDRLGAQPGQFFLWRFLDRNRWCASHPFSLSEISSGGDSFRITVKAPATSRPGNDTAGNALSPKGLSVSSPKPPAVARRSF
jgi:ferredoxin-NADP reductase